LFYACWLLQVLHLPSKQQFYLSPWKEAGLPYIQNFDPKEYQADAQNRYITQDKRGIMYFGNEQGMLILVVKSPVLAKCRGLAFAFKHDNIPYNDPSSILYSF